MLLDFLTFIFGKLVFFCGSVIGSTSFPKPLPPEEEKNLLERIKKIYLAGLLHYQHKFKEMLHKQKYYHILILIGFKML